MVSLGNCTRFLLCLGLQVIYVIRRHNPQQKPFRHIGYLNLMSISLENFKLMRNFHMTERSPTSGLQ